MTGKKTRKNHRRGTETKRHFGWLARLRFGFNLAIGLTAVATVTAAFILIHDTLTQCDYFRVKDLKIEGLQRLTPAQVAQQAQLQPDANILAVNLTLVRKRLLADPWIAEAEVKREIPWGLCIRIKEHTPLAVIDVGEKFLINQRGEIFKEWNPADPQHLPVISGLEVGDLKIYPSSALPDRAAEPGSIAPFNAVMQVLQLGNQQGSILPNRIIKYIYVDRQMGVTLYAFDQLKMINLGYNNYASKYHMLENLFSYLKHQDSVVDFSRIDLNNVNRIVLDPSNN